jgi:hypothetical protein
MERTKNTPTLRWKKVGGGSFHAVIGGKQRIIKPGEIFEAKLEEIPEGFRDLIAPVNEGAKKVMATGTTKEDTGPVPEVEIKPAVYDLVHKGGSWYNVVDSDGKVMNEKALRKGDAEALIENLMQQ